MSFATTPDSNKKEFCELQRHVQLLFQLLKMHDYQNIWL